MEEGKDTDTEGTVPRTTEASGTNSGERVKNVDDKTIGGATSAWSSDPKRKKSLSSETNVKEPVCGANNSAVESE